MSILSAVIVPHPPIILPDVGKGEEKKIQKTIDAYREAARRIAALQPETVVVISPHSVMYADYFHISPGSHAKGDMKRFHAPACKLEAQYDTSFVQTLVKKAGIAHLPAGTLGERDSSLDHGTFIPLWFLNQEYTNYQLIRIGLSGLPLITHYQLGQCITETAEELNRKVVIIASGDLSHKLTPEGPYGFAPEGPQFDREITDAMAKGDFGKFLTFDENFCDNAAVCGLPSFTMMAGALDGKHITSELLFYEGPFGVGYAVAVFSPGSTDETRRYGLQWLEKIHIQAREKQANEDIYVQLARLSVETYVKTGQKAETPAGLPKEMLSQQAGVFVSLKKYGKLRGCIGTIGPVTANIAEEILRNGVSACSEDPRFDPVQPEELEDLVYSVDVLEKPEQIDSIQALDPSQYGVIVTNGYRRGLLLPNLEGVNTAEKQIAIAKQKANIRPEETCILERFKVVRHL